MSKIMIVDDNEDIVQTLKTIIEKEKFSTETAYNGKQFLEKVKEINPDLVLLDVMMPGLTTKQILDQLKEIGMEKLKVILVTVVRFSDHEREELMKNYNIVDYITKPFDLLDFIKRVKKQIE